jgi:hypothetical protein
MKNSFERRFYNQKWRNYWRKQLEKLKQQPGESVEHYYSKFKRAIRKSDIQLTDEQKRHYFEKGLKKGMLPIVNMHGPNDLDELVELIQKFEEAEDLEDELEPGDEYKYKKRTYKKKKKVIFESDSSEDETPVKKNNKKKEKEIEKDPIEELTKQM